MGMNYTELDTAFMVEKYSAEPTMETVQYLAEKLGKTTKSIIGKLSREGVYKRAVYKSKSGEMPITKVELVSNIAENLGVEVEALVGLEKSPKATLKTLEVATGLNKPKCNFDETEFDPEASWLKARPREPWNNRS
jgi:L,D-peptidoglycan transpeptidase YkuD (ErfK/YbiS/YcfS/YnhG family)